MGCVGRGARQPASRRQRDEASWSKPVHHHDDSAGALIPPQTRGRMSASRQPSGRGVLSKRRGGGSDGGSAGGGRTLTASRAKSGMRAIVAGSAASV